MRAWLVRARAYAVAHRGASRDVLLSAVGRQLGEDVQELALPLALLVQRELDGDVILERAVRGHLARGGDPEGVRLAVAAYLKRYPTLSNEDDDHEP